MKNKKELSLDERLKKCDAELTTVKTLFETTNAETQKLNGELAPYFKRLGIRYEEEEEGKERIVEIDYWSGKGIWLRGIAWISFEDPEVNLMTKKFAMAIIMIYPSLQLSKTAPPLIKNLESQSTEIKKYISEKNPGADSLLKTQEKMLKKLKKELKTSESQLELTRSNTDYDIATFNELKHKIPFLN